MGSLAKVMPACQPVARRAGAVLLLGVLSRTHFDLAFEY